MNPPFFWMKSWFFSKRPKTGQLFSSKSYGFSFQSFGINFTSRFENGLNTLGRWFQYSAQFRYYSNTVPILFRLSTNP